MTTDSQHQAAFLDGATKPLRVGPIDTPQPDSNELLIRVRAIAINPVDWKIQDSGAFIRTWPALLGEDIAGEIVAVGDEVKRFSVGQRVLAHCQSLANGDKRQAGFQQYSIVPDGCAAAIPDTLSFEQASVLPLSISTAASGLFMKDFLALPYPTMDAKSGSSSILVWGGSSSNGMAAIQLAAAAGLKVVTTCSPRNIELCKSLGARVFDYNSPSIVGDLVAELQEVEFVGAYDAIGTREAEMQTAQVVAAFGGGKIASVLPPPEEIPATVRSGQVFAPNIFTAEPEVGKAIWQHFLPEALSKGQFVAKPDPEVLGHGLVSLQSALDAHKKGVSAKKIVVAL